MPTFREIMNFLSLNERNTVEFAVRKRAESEEARQKSETEYRDLHKKLRESCDEKLSGEEIGLLIWLIGKEVGEIRHNCVRGVGVFWPQTRDHFRRFQLGRKIQEKILELETAAHV